MAAAEAVVVAAAEAVVVAAAEAVVVAVVVVVDPEKDKTGPLELPGAKLPREAGAVPCKRTAGCLAEERFPRP